MNKLKQWFIELHSEFGDEVPPPEAFNDVIRVVHGAFGATPVKYLGAGDNGIAYLANDNDIIKFTIDKNEALLWHRLKAKTQSGITQLKEVANLASSKTGDSHVYVLKAEYAPNPVTPQQGRLIQHAAEAARQATEADLRRMGSKRTTELYRIRRTINFVRQFQEIADQDPAFEEIPGLLMDLADKHKGYIYDLQPDNFRRNINGNIILVDPSVPDLVGDIQNPQTLLYEDKLELILSSRRIYYEAI